MSQQINLYNPAFLKRRDWLTARPLVAIAGVLLLLVVVAAVFASYQARQKQIVADDLAAKLKDRQAEVVALTAQITGRKPDPAVLAQVDDSKLQLKARQEVMAAVEGGAIGSSEGFSEFLRGFARQTPQGLWLTGFTIGSGGKDMEIRGRMLTDTLLPEYVKRLSAEKAFKGRSFAGLDLRRPASSPPGANAIQTPAPAGTAATQAAQPVRYIEFTLMPRPQGAPEARP
ncbi:MAG: hypothetical protein EG825_12945 [Rhodocyclaceae bacterium]|nr:hypothetical protein [Rhodocyclaceae bacterium]